MEANSPALGYDLSLKFPSLHYFIYFAWHQLSNTYTGNC